MDKGRGGKTTSGNGQAWSLASPRGQWRTGKNGENWLQNHLWCPNDPCGQGIDDDNDDDDVYIKHQEGKLKKQFLNRCVEKTVTPNRLRSQFNPSVKSLLL